MFVVNEECGSVARGDLDADGVAYNSNRLQGKSDADYMLSGLDIDLEAFVQFDCHGVVLSAGCEPPDLAVDHYRAGPAVPLAVELDLA